jgi:proteic killer suppression protein
MIRSFRHRRLEQFWTRGDASRLRPDWIPKLERMLDALDAAVSPRDMAILGAGFHALRGDRKGRYALSVSCNWRLTFGWRGQDALEVDLEDYHG